MGLLREIFSRPIVSKAGKRGDLPLQPEAVSYSGLSDSERAVLHRKKQEQRRAANQRWVARRAALPPEQLALEIRGLLRKHGQLTKKNLGRLLTVHGPALDAATTHGQQRGWFDLERRSNHPIGGGPTAEFWKLKEQSQPQADQPPEQLSRYWLQSPPGGATLGGKPYRAGRFIPATTLFTHTPGRQQAINPHAPVPYAPLPVDEGQGDLTQAPATSQPDGTWAMPIPGTAPQAVQGAPQTVGGEAMFPAQPSQPLPQQPAPPPNPQHGLGAGAPPQARPTPQTPHTVRTPGLPPDQAVLEVQSQLFAQQNYPMLRDLYFQTNAVLDPVSGDVRSLWLDGDAWRELLPGYTGTNSPATQAAATYLNDQLFRESLQNQAGKGNNRMMVLGGGGGSGKGTAVPDFLHTAEYPLVVDQTSRDYPKLAAQFEAARAAGMQPEYLFIDRPAAPSMEAAVERALAERREGKPARTVPLDMLARTNLDARRTALAVLFGQPHVDARVIDNRTTGRFQRRMITDRTEAAHYLAHRLWEDERDLQNGAVERLRQSIIARNKKGEIPADIVTGLLGEGWHVRPPLPLNQTNRSART